MYSQAVQIEEHVPLAPFTTFRVGGPARYLAKIEDETELVEAVGFARRKALPLFVLGGGSNVLVSDRGFVGVVLRIAIDGPAAIQADAESVTYTVPAGMDWDAFVLDVCRRGLSGVESLAGIPGLVGGTPVQNVGAYGQEVAETIVAVRALDLKTMRFVSLSAADCKFGYRKSLFNSTARGRYIVTEVSFRFQIGKSVEPEYAELKARLAGGSPTPLDVYEAVRAVRDGKGMLLVKGEPDCRSAGSFFKNPVMDEAALLDIASELHVQSKNVPHWPAGQGRVKLAAAWLVETAGFHKGFTAGRAGISSRHTLALVNKGGATASEILALRDEIQSRVKERFGVELEQEPVMVG